MPDYSKQQVGGGCTSRFGEWPNERIWDFYREYTEDDIIKLARKIKPCQFFEI